MIEIGMFRDMPAMVSYPGGGVSCRYVYIHMYYVETQTQTQQPHIAGTCSLANLSF